MTQVPSLQLFPLSPLLGQHGSEARQVNGGERWRGADGDSRGDLQSRSSVHITFDNETNIINIFLITDK